MAALRRRAKELHASARREILKDQDSGALLLFYAAECALKATYMHRNNLKNTADARGSAVAARTFLHNLMYLVQSLNIPRASLKQAPPRVLSRSGLAIDVPSLHQAWRYGEKVDDTTLICEWLISIIKWCEIN
ncbi:hypothetical protein [Janthinobacterium sp. GMG1]|uniref:hypothetical protein n=1 Tax=Janthinobacterium sp. GMG1 TaxID=3096007 RepID=UPI002ACA662B|nr:hypothetical protein [Janthinobacterium sp. GMG1]MDZ5636925.1 hypothetical protein [Janthinobacterium sp. GMG1]